MPWNPSLGRSCHPSDIHKWGNTEKLKSSPKVVAVVKSLLKNDSLSYFILPPHSSFTVSVSYYAIHVQEKPFLSHIVKIKDSFKITQCCLLKVLNSQLFLHLKVGGKMLLFFLLKFKTYRSPKSAALATLSSPETHPSTHIIGVLTWVS